MLNGGFCVAALRADTGNKEGQGGHLLADRFEFVGAGRADDETDIVVFVPRDGTVGDTLVERAARVEVEILEVSAAGI